MNTLSIESLFRPVAGLINMPWLYGIKTRHDINGKMSPIIWKINFSRKVSIISGMRVKNCYKKKKKKKLEKKT